MRTAKKAAKFIQISSSNSGAAAAALVVVGQVIRVGGVGHMQRSLWLGRRRSDGGDGDFRSAKVDGPQM